MTAAELDIATSPADSGTPALVTTGLTKVFGKRAAVDALDLRVPVGAVYGFLGPNGSGKTTTIRMLVGLIRPTAGRVELLGRPMPTAAAEVLPRVGALIEGPAFHPYLSGAANLRRLDAGDRWSDPRTARVRIDTALDRVGLTAAAGKRYRAYSLGMKQRLAIAGALLAPRDLLILDEPTNGLDPQGTREVRNLVRSLAADGATVFVSSHLLSEIEQVCSHVGIMRHGRLVSQGTVAETRGSRTGQVRLDTDQPAAAVAALHRLGLADVTPSATGVTATLGSVALADVVPALVAADVPVLGFAAEQPTLEDLFVSLTGEGFDVSG